MGLLKQVIYKSNILCIIIIVIKQCNYSFQCNNDLNFILLNFTWTSERIFHLTHSQKLFLKHWQYNNVKKIYQRKSLFIFQIIQDAFNLCSKGLGLLKQYCSIPRYDAAMQMERIAFSRKPQHEKQLYMSLFPFFRWMKFFKY